MMDFSIGERLRKNGVKLAAASFSIDRIRNKKDSLEDEKRRLVPLIFSSSESNAITDAYIKLHEIYLQPGAPAPAQALIGLIKKTGRLPNINSVVDAYNLVSASTFLSIGSHDCDKIVGSLRIDVCDGTELYTPLGKKEPQKVAKGEYACMDEEKVICWLDIKQCEQTKITKDTKRFLVYIQGNRETPMEYLREALARIIYYETIICGAGLVETVYV